MTEAIWYLRGWVRLRLTSADCTGRLREFSRENRLEEVVIEDVLSVSFSVPASQARMLRTREGERLEVICRGGLPEVFRRLWRWRLLTAAVLILLALTVFLPSRIWFIRVEGNGEIPHRLIAEYAAQCGVSFGASRRQVRSEQVKNHLLWAIPELRWAGVNTEGCTAVITVLPRSREEQPPDTMPGDLVSVLDALVTQVVPQRGTAMVSPGLAVKAGQVLISGATDLGITVRLDRAAGEVYGLTRRSVTAVLPEKTTLRQGTGRVVRKYSLRIGKKYVNFSNDSGILHGSCVKMRTVKNLELPGGFCLPVALVTETYFLCSTVEAVRQEPEETLLDAARACVKKDMTAGTILEETTSVDGTHLTAVFECREMIAGFRPGIQTEGETNDRENRERGAG